MDNTLTGGNSFRLEIVKSLEGRAETLGAREDKGRKPERCDDLGTCSRSGDDVESNADAFKLSPGRGMTA